MDAATLAYVLELLAFALGGTLLQGSLLWLSWRGASRLIPAARPELRYRVAALHFALLAALPVLTIASLHLGFATMGGEISREKPVVELPQPTVNAAYLGLLATVVASWWFGVGAHAIKLFGEFARLAATSAQAAPAILIATVDRLRVSGGIRRRIEARIAAVAGPQVIGLRRTILMVPADFMARLPATERDAVLLHELAHARRRDFAWNLLQRLGLALVWFHPAAWALYRGLAFEREAACDAMAVRQGATPKTLAQGLLRLAEERSARTVAMASSGGAALSQRLHRLLSPEPAPPSALARVAIAGGVLGVFGAALALAAPGFNAARMQDRYIASGFGPTVVVNARDPAGSFALRIRQGRVVQASIERQSVPGDRILQQGDNVVLLGANRRPALSLRVFPNGRIRWDARD